MPSLRLTDREAADITAYLMASRAPEFENLEVPAVDEATCLGAALLAGAAVGVYRSIASAPAGSNPSPGRPRRG